MASVLKSGFFWLIGASERAAIPNTVRFYETVASQPAIKAIWGDLEYVEKSPQYVPPAKPKKEKEAAPVTAKPKQKPAKEAEADEEGEPLVPEEPRTKNPLDDLPKSSFNLEQWKREYSNRDTRDVGGSLEWFYDKYVFQDGTIMCTELITRTIKLR